MDAFERKYRQLVDAFLNNEGLTILAIIQNLIKEYGSSTANSMLDQALKEVATARTAKQSFDGVHSC
jgi:hypothetical protein